LALGRLSHNTLPVGETFYRQAKSGLLNAMCTSYLQPENDLCHVGVLEVGRAGMPGVLRDTII